MTTKTIRITRIVGICGSREIGLTSLEYCVSRFVRSLPQDHTCMLVTGGAPGIDRIAIEQQEALCMPYAVIPYFSDYGPKGGFERNATLVDFVHEMYAFWNLVSRGTKDTIRLAHKCNKLKDVYGPSGEIVELFK